MSSVRPTLAEVRLADLTFHVTSQHRGAIPVDSTHTNLTMPFHIAIVGGSLAGLAAANGLHRLGHAVTVYEKFVAPLDTRSSSLGSVGNTLWGYVRGAPMLRLGRRNKANGVGFEPTRRHHVGRF